MSHTTTYILGDIQVDSKDELRMILNEFSRETGYIIMRYRNGFLLEDRNVAIEIGYDEETKKVYVRHSIHSKTAFKLVKLLKNYIRAKIAEMEAKKLNPFAKTNLRILDGEMVELEVYI